MKTVTNMQELQSGALLQGGKYRIEKVLGQGGFGITYEGVQTGLGRRVAIKEFFMKEYCNRDDQTSQVSVGSQGSRDMVDDFRMKFIKEAQLIARMEDAPHIVRIHDIFEENGTAYYVMEYIGGGSLSQLLKKRGPLTEDDAIGYVRQIGEALSYLHDQNTLHLDIKPSNVLINRKGEAVLIDFGVSKHYDQSGSQTSSTPVGLSKGFAPSEQYQSGGVQQFTPATDVYSLGATLYNLLTNQVPPEASIIFEDGLPPRPHYISVATWQAIEQAMQPRRKDRTQTVEDFLQALVPAVEPEPSVALSPAVAPSVSTSRPVSSGLSAGAGTSSSSAETRLAAAAPAVRKGAFGELAFLAGLIVLAFLTAPPLSYTIGHILPTSVEYLNISFIVEMLLFGDYYYRYEFLPYLLIYYLPYISIMFLGTYGLMSFYGILRTKRGKATTVRWFDGLAMFGAILISVVMVWLWYAICVNTFCYECNDFISFNELVPIYILVPDILLLLLFVLGLIFAVGRQLYTNRPCNDWLRWMVTILLLNLVGINMFSFMYVLHDVYNYFF